MTARQVAFGLFGLVLTAGSAHADICEEWWFARNLVFDRAGYCFNSTLGKTLFDNTGCTHGAPELSAEASARVALIREMETAFECRVDSSAQQIKLPDLVIRRKERLVRVRDMHESACIGWQKADLPLYLDASEDAPQTGAIMRGASVLLDHVPEDNWNYVTVTHGDVSVSGWVQDFVYSEDACEAWAG